MERFFACLIILCSVLPAQAGKYSPPGLYDVDYITLENGFKVVLNERAGAHNTAIRLVVNIGKQDFPHGKKETAHFLEHLLFAGTSKHSEEGLEKIIESNGGTWNAQTRWFHTVFEIDIYSGAAQRAINILYEIISDSTLAPEKVELTRDIIHRESNGRPSKLRRWLFTRGIGKSAYEKAYEILLPDSPYEYRYLETADDISREEILHAYKTFYIPNNMTLIVVGEFDRIELMKKIGSTFGILEEKPAPKKEIRVPLYPDGPAEVSGTLSPVLDSDGSAGIAFRTDGSKSKDFYALWLLRDLLSARIYDSLRIQEGLAYGPGASYHAWENFGTLFLTADVDIRDMDNSIGKTWRIIDEVTSGEIDPESIRQTQQGMLLRLTRSYETNAGKSDYYVDFLHELESHGAFVDAEEQLAKVSPKQVIAVAKKYMTKEKAVSIKSKPTLTYTQFYMLLVFASLVVVFLFLRIVRRRKRKKRRGLEFHG